MSVISAGTTTTTAFKVTGDTTGTLQLKTGAVPTTAIDISATQVVTFPATTTLNFTGTLLLGDGSAAAPTLAHSGDTNTGIYFPGADQIAITTAGTQRFVVDAIGNIGVGVTPSAWSTAGNLQLSNFGSKVDGVSFANNAYFNSGWKYASNGFAGLYSQVNGQHIFYIAPTGTINNAVSLTQAMTLQTGASNDRTELLIGTSTVLYSSANRGNITLNGASNALLGLAYGGTAGGYLYTDSGGITLWCEGSRTLNIGTASSGPVTFTTNNAERARITNDGNFVVGTTSSSRRFQASFSSGTAYNSNSMETSSLLARIVNPDGTVGNYAGIHFATANNSDAAIAGVRTADAEMAITFGTRGSGSGNIIERARIASNGDFSIIQSPGRYTVDTSVGATNIANGGTVNFSNASGMLVVNDWGNGGVTIYLCGGGSVTVVSSVIGQVGTLAYNAGVNGYTWTNNTGVTRPFGFFFARTRSNA